MLKLTGDALLGFGRSNLHLQPVDEHQPLTTFKRSVLLKGISSRANSAGHRDKFLGLLLVRVASDTSVPALTLCSRHASLRSTL